MLLASLILLSLTFVGCYDIIFARIMGEVKLEEPKITGHINSIVRFNYNGTECLVTQNGKIHYKNATSQSHDDWSELMQGLEGLSYKYYEDRFVGVFISQLASDEHYVYAIGHKFNENEGRNTLGQTILYVFDSSWKELGEVARSSSIFCTNSHILSHRQAFIRLGEKGKDGSKVYKLNASFNPTSPTDEQTGDGAGNDTESAVWCETKVLFFSSASCTNEDEKIAYHASGSKVIASDSTLTVLGEYEYDLNNVLSLARCKDKLIVGTEGKGLFVVGVGTNGEPLGQVDSAIENTSVAISNYTTYRMDMLFCVDPTQSESSAILYATVDFKGQEDASSGNFKNIGLWAYYPNRGNWNRE